MDQAVAEDITKPVLTTKMGVVIIKALEILMLSKVATLMLSSSSLHNLHTGEDEHSSPDMTTGLNQEDMIIDMAVAERRHLQLAVIFMVLVRSGTRALLLLTFSSWGKRYGNGIDEWPDR